MRFSVYINLEFIELDFIMYTFTSFLQCGSFIIINYILKDSVDSLMISFFKYFDKIFLFSIILQKVLLANYLHQRLLQLILKLLGSSQIYL